MYAKYMPNILNHLNKYYLILTPMVSLCMRINVRMLSWKRKKNLALIKSGGSITKISSYL